MQPSPEALAWQRRADDWAQQSESDPGQAVEPANRWSEVAETGRTAFPADGVGWRTETAEWRATGARWRQTTEWRSTTGSHGWRSTTEAWQTDGNGNYIPPAQTPAAQPAISGPAVSEPAASSSTAWSGSADESAEPTRSWQQPADARPSWQQFASPSAATPSQPSTWQQPAQRPPAESSASWQQLVEPTPADVPPRASAPNWQREAIEGSATWTDAAETRSSTGSWRTPAQEPRETPAWQREQAPETPSWQQTPETPSWQRAQAPETPSWQQTPETPSWQRAQAPETPSWQRPPAAETTSWQQAGWQQAPSETPSRRRGEAPSWQTPRDDGRHLVREDDRAAWRGDAEAGDGSRQVGRRRAPESGSGWSTRSDADDWAGHTDTGNIQFYAEPEPETTTWGARTEPPARRRAAPPYQEGRQDVPNERRALPSSPYGEPAADETARRYAALADLGGDQGETPPRGGSDRRVGGRRYADEGRPGGPLPDEDDRYVGGARSGPAAQFAIEGRAPRQDGPRRSAQPRYNKAQGDWREQTGSWEAEPDTSSWVRDPDTGQWSRSEDDPRILAWRAEAARRETTPEPVERRELPAAPSSWQSPAPTSSIPTSAIPTSAPTNQAGMPAAPRSGIPADGRRRRDDRPQADGYGARRGATYGGPADDAPTSTRTYGAPVDEAPPGGQTYGAPAEAPANRRGYGDAPAYGRGTTGYDDPARGTNGYEDPGRANGYDQPGRGGGAGYDGPRGRTGYDEPGRAGVGDRRPGRVPGYEQPALGSSSYDPTGRSGGAVDGDPGRRGADYGSDDPGSRGDTYGARAAYGTRRPEDTGTRRAAGYDGSTGFDQQTPRGDDTYGGARAETYGRDDTYGGGRGNTYGSARADTYGNAVGDRPPPAAAPRSGVPGNAPRSAAPGNGITAAPRSGVPRYGEDPYRDDTYGARQRFADERGLASGPADGRAPGSYAPPAEDRGPSNYAGGRPPGNYGSPTGDGPGSYSPTPGNYGPPADERNYGSPPATYGSPPATYGSPPATYGSPADERDYGSPAGNRPPGNYGSPTEDRGRGAYAPPAEEPSVGRRRAPVYDDRDDWRDGGGGGAGAPAEEDQSWPPRAGREQQQRGAPASWQLTERENTSHGSAPYRDGGGADWRRDLADQSDLAEGESRRYGTADFVPFQSGGSAAVPRSSNLSMTSTSLIMPAGGPDAAAANAQRATGFMAPSGSYERRPVTGSFPTIRRGNLLDPDDEEEEQASGGPLAAVGYTVIWYGVPVVLFIFYMLVVNSGTSTHALDTLAKAAPQFAISLILSIIVAVGLRFASSSWKAVSVGLAAAVVGGGLATVLSSAITGNSLS